MTNGLNATHDPALRSWVESANVEGADFPIQNLPFSVFRRRPADEARCAVGIGNMLLDVGACAALFEGPSALAARACRAPVLNELMALGPSAASALRAQLSRVLSADHEQHRSTLGQALVFKEDAELLLPVRISGFTDFFASVHHATNAGRLFRPDMPLLPNYKYVPIAYNGRANSVRASGAMVQRPHGQLKTAAEMSPRHGPAQRLDYEVELGLYIGAPSTPGQPVQVDDAWRHMFGFSLLNDWSARDIQSWEYQPLGPFLAKSFATTVAPWVVTTEALAPFRIGAATRPRCDPSPLPYLHDARDQRGGGLQIELEARLRTRQMTVEGATSELLSRSSTATLYWTFAQMVTHHTSNGSSLDTGDLLGSGTVSGPGADALGSLLEISEGGSKPLILANGEQRIFLADGDEVTLTGRCEAPGRVGIGFGECAARLLAAAT